MAKAIFKWQVPKNLKRYGLHDAVPEAYLVYLDPSSSRIKIYAQHDGQVYPDVKDTSLLVRHLLQRLGKLPDPDFRHCYVARCKGCGTIQAVAMEDLDCKSLAAEVAGYIRAGMRV